jgi:hypothetical protein
MANTANTSTKILSLLISFISSHLLSEAVELGFELNPTLQMCGKSSIDHLPKMLFLNYKPCTTAGEGHGRQSSQQRMGGSMVQNKTQQHLPPPVVSGAYKTKNPKPSASTANRSTKILTRLKSSI